ncbi:uncharacterized protein LOC126839618 [Adelges cooleyi]|uniref:uncharacterized protein LOC126839618 n=1 Tax=Adelges cooleyi TaxID=133065 RepID=UPI00217FF7BD|nr:uncharacterized protein LOC126839618 [Adelges cooleyi]XP_050430970.1 uncharacterized protein LOC126839618 [Adelges cooleyi]XP_050430971.1 uncharacterized protein LOC126839618 [Adelges cooleyi]
MNSNMRHRCVVLFAIFFFGLIISLDAAPKSGEKRKKGSSSNAATSEKEEDSQAIKNLEKNILIPRLDNCFSDNKINEPSERPIWKPFILVQVLAAQRLILTGQQDEIDQATLILTNAIQSMAIGDNEIYPDKESLDHNWSRWDEIRKDEKEDLIEDMNKAIEKFVLDLGGGKKRTAKKEEKSKKKKNG